MKKTNSNSRVFMIKVTLLGVLLISSLNINSQESSGEFDYLKNINSTLITLNINNSEEIPEDLFKLKKLEELTIKGDNIIKIPVEIRNLYTLRVLNLSNTSVESLPEELSQLRQLQEIHLNYEIWQYKLDDIKRITRAKIILE